MQVAEDTARGNLEGAVGRYWIGIDVGGTFTDYVVYDSVTGELNVFKIPTPADKRAETILAGLDALVADAGLSLGEVAFIGHGSTVATNALITRQGPTIGLLTTEGFGDLLTIRRQTRPDAFDYYKDYPAPLVRRDRTIEISERSDARGRVLVPVDLGQVQAAMNQLQRDGVRSIAVSFLHSYVNPSAEQAVGQIAAEFPDLLVTLSSELVPEFREYERTSTTVINTYVRPVVIDYMTAFADGLRERAVPCPPVVMQGNGGLTSVETATRQPVSLVRSGPAAGLAAARALGTLAGEDQLITFDMGGTTTDVAIVGPDGPTLINEWDVHSYPIKWPALDIRSVGAGGGSVAWVDDSGLLKVGPASAGASPGPACYGRGGAEPTLTDANVVLGRIGSSATLGAAITVDYDKAASAVGKLAEQLGCSLHDAAAGVVEIVDAALAAEVRIICAERGAALDDHVLVAYGGAGGLHAVNVAMDLGISRVFVPTHPGLVCALGVLLSRPRADFGITSVVRLDTGDSSRLDSLCGDLEAREKRWLDEQRIPYTSISRRWTAEMRYRGQSYELAVPFDPDNLDIPTLADGFHSRHSAMYGHSSPELEVECVNVRLTIELDVDHPPIIPRQSSARATNAAERDVYFYRGQPPISCHVYPREMLQPGVEISGPAVVEQMDATVLVPPTHAMSVDEFGNLHVVSKG